MGTDYGNERKDYLMILVKHFAKKDDLEDDSDKRDEVQEVNYVLIRIMQINFKASMLIKEIVHDYVLDQIIIYVEINLESDFLNYKIKNSLIRV